MTAAVETARGPVDVGALGTTLMHEHIFILSPEVQQNFTVEWDEEREVYDAAERLNQLKTAGIDTLVDLTVLGLGRYIPRIQRVAARTSLNIVVATGLYTYDELPLFFHVRGPGTVLGGPEVLTDLFVRDITEGILDTGVKAAILKCATDEKGITPGVERCCGPWRWPIGPPARRSRPIPTLHHDGALSSRTFSNVKVSICVG